MKIKFIKLKNKKRVIILISIAIMIVILFFSGCSIGKALSNTQIQGNGKIAEPIIIVENGSEVKLTNKQNEGNYIFKVKNYNDNGKITQIDMKYYIEILNKKSENISIKLLKGDQEIQIENNKTTDFLLSKDQKQTDEYQLKIEHDKTKTIDEIIENIQIKIHSEQLKI